ncbi:hypothetical protein GCK32_015796 [Trichostrongylus colubriformis]|uniref:Uncharacterized protein n=1 Tax=Trichostrongylus colubriformis TaxID=6319 RepID=A0AAN8G6X6_TRICO
MYTRPESNANERNMLLRDFVLEAILWICVTTIYFPLVEAMACYVLNYAVPELAKGAINYEDNDCCEVYLEFGPFPGHHQVEYYRYLGAKWSCRETGTFCFFEGYNTSLKWIPDRKKDECYEYKGPLITVFHDEKSVSEIRRGSINCLCNTSSICATKPETFEVKLPRKYSWTVSSNLFVPK